MLGGRPQRRVRALDGTHAHERFAEPLRERPRARLVGRQPGGDVQRPLVQARGLAVGVARRSPAAPRARRSRPPARRRPRSRPAGSGRRSPPAAARGRGRRAASSASRRHPVQLGSPRRAEALQQRVADELVLEGEAPRIGDGHEDPAAQRGVEALEDLGLRPAEHAGERREAKPAADDGGGAERLDHVLVERREPAPDRVAHAVGERQRAVERAGVVQAPLTSQELHDLVDVERVARARRVDVGHELRGDALRPTRRQAAGARGGEPADVVAVQSLQRQPRRRPREPAERGGELVAGVRLEVAVGGDRQQRHVGQRARDELQRQQGGGVGPVQVVEDDDERPAVRDGGRGGSRAPRRAGSAAGRIEPWVVGGRRLCARELGQEAREPGRTVAEQVGAARPLPRGARARGRSAPRASTAGRRRRPSTSPRPTPRRVPRRARRTPARAPSCRSPARR